MIFSCEGIFVSDDSKLEDFVGSSDELKNIYDIFNLAKDFYGIDISSMKGKCIVDILIQICYFSVNCYSHLSESTDSSMDQLY